MEKVHLIGWALLLTIVAGSAITVTVNSIAEGQAILGRASELEEIGCKVYNISKEASAQDDFDKPWVVTFAMEYMADGVTRDDVRTTTVATNTEAEIAKAVEPICEADWAAAQAKHGTVDNVIVKTLVEDNPILGKMYSAVNNRWTAIAAVGN